MTSVDALVTGRWILSLRQPSRLSVRKSAMARFFCALSGGVDSSVAAVLLSKAIGKQLTCVFVDHGLLRKNEGDEVEAVFGPDGHLRPELYPCQCTAEIL